MQGGVGKALGQLQYLDILIQLPDGVLAALCQQIQPVGNGLLCGQQIRQIDVGHGIEHLYAQFLVLDAAVQCTRQLFRRLVDKVGCGGQQLRPGQAGMAIARIMAQRAQQGSFQPLGTVPFHMVILGDAVRMAEVQLQRLPAKQIRVGGDGLHGPHTKGAEHLHGLAGADLELCQISDKLPHPEHPLELLLDAVGLIRRDAWDLGQPGGVVGDDLQRLSSKHINDLIRSFCPDIRQGAAGQKGIYRLQILGHIGFALLRVELAAIGSVVLVPAAAENALACMQLAHNAAHHREHTAARDLEHHVAVIRIFVDNILHDALDLFQLLFVHQLHLLLHRYYKYSPFGGICKLLNPESARKALYGSRLFPVVVLYLAQTPYTITK